MTAWVRTPFSSRLDMATMRLIVVQSGTTKLWKAAVCEIIGHAELAKREWADRPEAELWALAKAQELISIDLATIEVVTN